MKFAHSPATSLFFASLAYARPFLLDAFQAGPTASVAPSSTAQDPQMPPTGKAAFDVEPPKPWRRRNDASTTSSHATATSVSSSVPSLSTSASPSPSTASFADSSLPSNQNVSIPFWPCRGNDTTGIVKSVTVSPCERGLDPDMDQGVDDAPCRFRFGERYSISIDFISGVDSQDGARSTLIARDDSGIPSLRFPHSGQSFDLCSYTTCPVKAGVPSTYTYHFNTYRSPMNNLVFNATATLGGPSLFCTTFDVVYIDDQRDETVDDDSETTVNDESDTTTRLAPPAAA